MGLVPNHCSKSNIKIKPVMKFVVFPLPIKVIFTLYVGCSVCSSIKYKKQCAYLNLKLLLLEKWHQ